MKKEYNSPRLQIEDFRLLDCIMGSCRIKVNLGDGDSCRSVDSVSPPLPFYVFNYGNMDCDIDMDGAQMYWDGICYSGPSYNFFAS